MITKINSMYQDETGILWIAANEGFFKYNGVELEKLETLTRLSQLPRYKNKITGNRQGSIYFGCGNNVMHHHIEDETDSPLFSPDIMHGKTLRDIHCVGTDSLLATAENQILLYHNKQESLLLSLPPSVVISKILVTSKHDIYIGTVEAGIWHANLQQHTQPVKRLNINSEVLTIYQDSQQNIWFGTQGGGLYYQPDGTHQLHRLQGTPETTNFISDICEDNHKNIWLSSMNKLIPTGKSQWKQEDWKDKINTSATNCMLKDNQGIIWLGTYSGGFLCFNPQVPAFRHIEIENTRNGWTTIQHMATDKKHRIWAATSTLGLACIDPQSEQTRFFNPGNHLFKATNIKSMLYDKANECLWIGTFLEGLYHFDITSEQFTHYPIDSNNLHTGKKLSEIIFSLSDSHTNIYIGTYDGIYTLNKNTRTITPEYLGIKNINNILCDPSGKGIYISNYSNTLCHYDLKSKEVTKYPLSTPSEITSIYQDNQQRIWIGTDNAGIAAFDPHTQTFASYNTDNCGIESNAIRNIAQTTSGLLVAGTDAGISLIDIGQRTSINYNSRNGFPLTTMKDGSIHTSQDSTLWLGGMNGIASLRKEMIRDKAPNTCQMFFSKLKVNNEAINVNDRTQILQQNIHFTKHITLDATQRLFELQFSTDNYLYFDPGTFEYSLEGFDHSWYDLPNNNTLRYMNIPAGHYTLIVRNKQNHAHNLSIEICILPPWYTSWYAYLIYGMLLIGIYYWASLFIKSRQELRQERKDKEQEAVINQWKLRFFTNIAHEFRTPLTLILGQLDLMMQSPKMAPRIMKYAESIHQNTTKLKSLITELLEFRQQEQGFLQIKVQEQNLVTFLKSIYDIFREYTAMKGIDFSFHTCENEIMAWFDYIQLEKVIYNLISNAIKHTPAKGSIELSIQTIESNQGKSIQISVKDTGCGIPQKSINSIFERFYHIDTNLTDLGTGIGLSLAKGIVELHGGIITVKSQENSGSNFIIELKTGCAHFEGNPNITLIEDTETISQQPIELPDTTFISDMNQKLKQYYPNAPLLLIVEDDEELRGLLTDIFSSFYRIQEAVNGHEGYLKAKEFQPDIILSDVLMPVMSGKEMCQKLKQDFGTCHIPIILLTALTGENDNIEGLNCGADDYVYKPFSAKLLITRCATTLQNRRILQEKFTTEPTALIQTITQNPIDEAFIQKLVQVIEANIGNEELDVPFLCNEMAISRTPFYKKVKGIAGLAPNEFIQNIRLKKAAWLLEYDPTKKITAISEELGFNSPDYFSYCFKSQYGVTPTKYRNDIAMLASGEV